MRRVPPTILIAIALMVVRSLANVVRVMSAGDIPAFPSWYLALVAGTGYAVTPLLIAGMLELRQRGAALGFGLVLALYVVQAKLIQSATIMEPAVREALGYAFLGAYLVAMGSLARAVWAKRPALALCGIAAAIISLPPPGLAYREFSLIQICLHLPELVVLLLTSLELARDAEPRPMVVANGLRHSARALCVFSAAAALAGIQAIHQPFALTALVVGALAWCAFGFLRAARSPFHRWLVSAAATAILWCTSVQLSALPELYGHNMLPEQSTIFFFMLVAAAAFVTRAAKGVVDNMQLQAKGIGAIMMFVTAFAITMFLVPQAQSERAMTALGVLTGFVTALGAWMLSWLCKLAAERFERNDSELPTARIV